MNSHNWIRFEEKDCFETNARICNQCNLIEIYYRQGKFKIFYFSNFESAQEPNCDELIIKGILE